MRRIVKTLENWWFSPVVPERLAILRIMIGSFSLWYLVTRFDMLQSIAKSSASMYEPVGLARVLQNPMTPELFNILLIITILLNIAYIIGWKFRWTGPAFGLLLLFMMSYRNSWSMIYHNYIATVLHVLVIGVAASADAISYDAWRQKGRNWREKGTADWQYGWGVKLICTATVATYVLSGLAKVFGELAWAWVDGSAMRSQVAVDALRKEMLGGAANPWFEWLYPHTEIFLIMGIGTMILELGAPAALLHRKIALGWAALTFSMHWGIYFIMGIDFPYHTTGLIFLSFFAIEKVWYQIQSWLTQFVRKNTAKTQPESAIILFDGVCNFCNSTIQFIISQDPKEYFRFASLQSEIGQQLLQQHNISADLSTIVLINKGKGYLRSSAILHIAKYLQFPWGLLYVFIITPQSWRDYIYNKIATHRYQWFGIKNECSVPTPAIIARFLE